MSDVVQISRSDVDVVDNDISKVATSNFPTLKIVKSGSITFTTESGVITIYEHNLGYYPAFRLWDSNGNFVQYTPHMSTTDLTIDSDGLVIDPGTGTPVATEVTYYYDIYALNVFDPREFASIDDSTDFTPSSAVNSILGISKEDQDISSMGVFTTALDNQYRSIMIHRVFNWDFVYADYDPMTYQHREAHGLSYAPSFLAYERLDGTDYIVEFYATDQPFYAVDDTNYTIWSTAGAYNSLDSEVSVIIFKDPMLLEK